VREWLETREDVSLLPVIEAAHKEWQKKGGRPWSEAEGDLLKSVENSEERKK